jgi:hypothetical protein
MYAVVVKVTIGEANASQEALRNEVVPRVAAAPGFVAGYWVELSEGKGTSIAVFESEGAAQAVAGQVEPPPGAPVTIDSVEIGEVVAHA